MARAFVSTNSLSSKSEYFRAAIDGGFKESTDNMITMMDVKPSAMAVVILHLYQGATDINGLTGNIETTFPNQFTMLEIQNIRSFAGRLDIHLLADRLMLADLKKFAEQMISSCLHSCRKVRSINILEGHMSMIYEYMPNTDCSLRSSVTAAIAAYPLLDDPGFSGLRDLALRHDPLGFAAATQLLSKLCCQNPHLRCDAHCLSYYDTF